MTLSEVQYRYQVFLDIYMKYKHSWIGQNGRPENSLTKIAIDYDGCDHVFRAIV